MARSWCTSATINFRARVIKVDYIYLGDRLTDPRYKKARCTAVRRADGKCKRGKNGNMLVQFEDGDQVIVLGRLLRKVNAMKNTGDGIFTTNESGDRIDVIVKLWGTYWRVYLNAINRPSEQELVERTLNFSADTDTYIIGVDEAQDAADAYQQALKIHEDSQKLLAWALSDTTPD